MENMNNQDIQVPDNYIDYHRVKISLVEDLRKIQNFSIRLQLNKSIGLIEDVISRFTNKSFSIAIVGEFRRGKSTLINALLGQEILPSAVRPTTATLCRVRYGLDPVVKLIFKDSRQQDVDINQLKDYVTQLSEQSKQNATVVKEAIIYYPSGYCQNNIEIVDTPGLNDIAMMTEVTLGGLRQADAAILVIMAVSPFSEYEAKFLENDILTNDLGHVMFVVSGIDRLNSPEDTDEIIQAIEKRILDNVLRRAEQQFGKSSKEYEVYLKKIGKPKVFGLSAYQALKAKQTGDKTLLSQSRFADFEAALEKFLTVDRGAVELQVPVNRAIASGNEIIQTINIRESALQMEEGKFQAAYDKAVADILELRKKKQEEMKQIDLASGNVKYNVRPKLADLEKRLKWAVEQAIDEIRPSLKPSEVDKPKALNEKLANKVSITVQLNSQKVADEIQAEIQRGLAKEITRLEDFIISVDQTLRGIEDEFLKIEGSSTQKRSVWGEVAIATVAYLTSMSGLYTGFRAAGWKGALAGGAASLGIFITTGLVTSIFALPVSLPVIAAYLIATAFVGDWAAKAATQQERLDAFIKDYQQKACQEISKKLQQNRLDQQVDDYITETFEALKRQVSQEVEALLDNTENTLADLRLKRGQAKAQIENELKGLNEMREETQRILGNAQRLSSQLNRTTYEGMDWNSEVDSE